MEELSINIDLLQQFMYFQYKSSSKRRCLKSEDVLLTPKHDIRTSLDQDPHQIKNYDVNLQFSQKNPMQYSTIKQYQQSDICKLKNIQNRAEEQIKNLKLGKNCKITETQGIQNEDSEKLMNFVIGGYVDNDFNEYLSIKQFNEMKEDFQVLSQIYDSSLEHYNDNKNVLQNQKHSFKQRSLLSVIFLNQNLSKQARSKMQNHMKKNKILW